MLDYIIKVLLFQTLFLAVYDLFLKRETFFQWNRFYLITTSVLAYVIPLVKIDRVQEIIPQEYVVLLPEVVLNPSTVIKEQLGQPITLFLVLKVIFWLGIAVASILFALRLYKLVRLITTHDKEFKPSYYLVWLHNNKAFSFFNYIFLGKETNNKTQIIEHELVHVKQKHSLDLLFFELQKIVCWFNPYSYLYQARISELHEFIADSKAIKKENKATYFNHLLAETFGVQNISFINPFFKHSLLKKRILMLNKNKSKQILKFKYVVLVPVLMGMLLYTSCEKSEPILENDNELEELLEQDPETQKFIDERLDKIIEELNKMNNLTDIDSEKKNELKEQFYQYLLKKREQTKIYGVVETQQIGEVVVEEGVPFAIIENSPVFPDCENAEDTKECLQQNISKFVGQKFNTNLTKGLGLDPGKKKVYVIFKIDKEGNVTEVRARGPHADLEAEAIRVVKSLPKMIPGEYQGEKVAVKYTLPITLIVE
ncbi:blaR1 peptidase M56 family protein [Aureibaculum algae]|uniref:BlaR1 peptidase M56 family protein n=1 Tax=Aureibaculum algae TaxID=2584122 RepID=A0A5B7TU86_9FLAO|nr:M56 family metallopeptidase [Aureibaculum algae]QCX40419.1 blaR1 peptidase M56 family protein [Aureibaculum algae]